MKFLNRLPPVQTKGTKSFATFLQPKTHIHSHLKSPKPNHILKRCLDSNITADAVLLFRDMFRQSPSSIDSFSFLFILKSCTQKPFSVEGKQLHALVIKFGYEHVVYLQTCLVNVYSAMGNIVDAHRVFDEIPCKSAVPWTALISAYVGNGKPDKALKIFRQMQMDSVDPDQITLTVALSACADLGALEMGEWIHAYIGRKQGLGADLCLKNALINMYAKCGDIESARRLFNGTKKKDVTTWTSMIVGHSLHGQPKEALELFSGMKEMNRSAKKNKRDSNRGSSLILPNDVTFIGVLMACSHAGMVEEGKHHFKSMSEDYGLKPRDSHYGCMVDLFCRAGLLKEAYNFIVDMPVRPNAVVWRTLLGVCSLHGKVELGAEVRRRLLELEPSHVADSVAMSNIYAARGMWDEKLIIRDQIKQRRAPGCSSIEVGSVIYEFVSADDDHPLSTEIYDVLKHLVESMRPCGYFLEPASLSEY